MDDRLVDDALSAYLGGLASPTRLAIMRALRSPKVLKDIDVRAEAQGPPITRQAIRKHLDLLLEIGVVNVRTVTMAYGDTVEYVVNHQRVFSVAEEVRNLARIAPTVEPSILTVGGGEVAPLARDHACLVLVKGLDEGRTFDLDPRSGASEWRIGRRRGLAVSVDFDPSTSGENAIVRWTGRSHTLEDVPGSRNGTWRNLVRLRPGEVAPLEHGDILGVGRCLFVYWA